MISYNQIVELSVILRKVELANRDFWDTGQSGAIAYKLEPALKDLRELVDKIWEEAGGNEECRRDYD